MSARDDYPLRRHDIDGIVFYTQEPGRWKDMCDEIDRLRQEVARLAVPAMRWACGEES